jgi:hypothetical protein
VRRPMPLVAPVTMVIFPSSLPIDVVSYLSRRDDTPPATRRCE